MLISELMTKDLAMESAMTRSLLSKVPSDKVSWKPTEEMHTIGWNANHLVETLSWVPGILSGSEWDIAPVGGEAYVTPDLAAEGKLVEAFDRCCAEAIAALNGVPNSVMDESWSLKMGGHVLFTMKKGDCLRKWVFSHSAHHRGILSVYLRMAGVPVTSVYEE